MVLEVFQHFSSAGVVGEKKGVVNNAALVWREKRKT